MYTTAIFHIQHPRTQCTIYTINYLRKIIYVRSPYGHTLISSTSLTSHAINALCIYMRLLNYNSKKKNSDGEKKQKIITYTVAPSLPSNHTYVHRTQVHIHTKQMQNNIWTSGSGVRAHIAHTLFTPYQQRIPNRILYQSSILYRLWSIEHLPPSCALFNVATAYIPFILFVI